MKLQNIKWNFIALYNKFETFLLDGFSLNSDLETWYILQSVQRKTNALILLSGYGAILRICFLFIYLFIFCFVRLFDLVFDVNDQQLRLLMVN